MAEINKRTRPRRNEAVSRTVEDKTENKKPKDLDKEAIENPYFVSDIK